MTNEHGTGCRSNNENQEMKKRHMMNDVVVVTEGTQLLVKSRLT